MEEEVPIYAVENVHPWLDMDTRWLLMVPRSCLLGQWAQESLVLEWCYCGVWMPEARVVPCSSSERHPGATCWGKGLRGFEHWIGVAAVTGSRQLRLRKSKFVLPGP